MSYEKESFKLPAVDVQATVFPMLDLDGRAHAWSVKLFREDGTTSEHKFSTESEALDFARRETTGTGHLDA